MRRVKTVLIGWHKCKASPDEIVGLLSVQGFALKKSFTRTKLQELLSFLKNKMKALVQH
jgi:ribonuclease PH